MAKNDPTNLELVKLDEIGHYAQEDWAEKVADALVLFLRRAPLTDA